MIMDSKKRKSIESKKPEKMREVKEMWDIVAGVDYEAGAVSVSDPEDDDEFLKTLFKKNKKEKTEKSKEEIAVLVEQLMAEFEIAAEDDALLNSEGKPAINKLRKLPLLINALSKKQLQHEFLDHGVLTCFKTWLEPLPDGSLPNFNIREAILKIMTDLPLDLDHLKRSGLGKVIMFFSRSHEETTSNRKLAKDLVDKWSREIFSKSTRFEDIGVVQQQRASVKKARSITLGLGSRFDDDLDLSVKAEQNSTTDRVVSRPEAMSMDFMVRPDSKTDPDLIKARGQDQRRAKVVKKLQHLKERNKKQWPAMRISLKG